MLQNPISIEHFQWFNLDKRALEYMIIDIVVRTCKVLKVINIIKLRDKKLNTISRQTKSLKLSKDT